MADATLRRGRSFAERSTGSAPFRHLPALPRKRPKWVEWGSGAVWRAPARLSRIDTFNTQSWKPTYRRALIKCFKAKSPSSRYYWDRIFFTVTCETAPPMLGAMARSDSPSWRS